MTSNELTSLDTGIISLDFCGVRVSVDSQYPFTQETFQGLAGAVTGMVVSSDATNIDATLLYQPANRASAEYDEISRTLRVEGPSQSFSRGIAIAHTAQYIAECLRSTKRTLQLVHAAAVATPNQDSSVVLFGGKGAGKTTLALRLCHQLQYGLIGNDQVYLGSDEQNRLHTEGGSDYFTVRKTAIESDEYLATLLKPHPDTHSGNGWNTKSRVEPKMLGLTVNTDLLPIQALFNVRIDRTEDRIRTTQWRGLQPTLILHEIVGRHISGQATPFLDDDSNYYGSLSPINRHQAMATRDNLVTLLLEHGITELSAPNSTEAVAYIADKTI